MQMYAEETGKLPPPAIYAKNGQPLLSWRVLLLDKLDCEELAGRFHRDEPWDSPHNIQLRPLMPSVYRCRYRTIANAQHATIYQVFVGAGTPFEDRKGISLSEIANGNGLALTLLAVEAEKAVPWTKPMDLPYSESGPLPCLGGIFTEKARPFSSDYWESKKVCQGLFADNHIDRVPFKEQARLRAMIPYRHVNIAQASR